MKHCLCLAILAAVVGAGAGELLNGDFAAGLEHWIAVPKTGAVTIEKLDGGGQAAVIVATGKPVSLTSDFIQLPAEKRNKAWVIEFRLLTEEISAGPMVFSVYCYNAAGKLIRQIPLLSLSTVSDPDWQSVWFQLNHSDKTRVPAETEKVALRFSFWNRKHDSVGKIKVADLRFHLDETGTEVPEVSGISDRLQNGDFLRGTTGWLPNPAKTELQVEADAEQGRVLALTAAGSNVGVDSLPVRYAGGHYLASFTHRGENTGQGSTVVAIKALDGNGKLLKQLSLLRTPTADWKDYRFKLGPGTEFELPEGTENLVFRMSFWAPKNRRPAGVAKLAKVILEPLAE